MSASDPQLGQSAPPKDKGAAGANTGGVITNNAINDKESLRGLEFFSFLLLVFVLLFMFVRWALPDHYAYVVQARTQLLTLTIDPRRVGEVKWQITGAVICSRTPLALPELSQDASPCGSARLKAYASGEAEHVLELVSEALVHMSAAPEGGFRLQIKALDPTQTAARLSSTASGAEVDTGGVVVLLWPGDDSDRALPPALGVLPFKGEAVLGRDVSWTASRLLLDGRIEVFRGDETAVSGRSQVSSSRLMLGDQLTAGEGEDGRVTQGFIRFGPGVDAMQVQLFGELSGLELTRYGESNFSLQPSWLVAFTSDPLLAWLFPVFPLLITLSANLKGGAHVFSWLTQGKAASKQQTPSDNGESGT